MITSSTAFGQDKDDIDEVDPEPLGLLGRWLPPSASELRPLMTVSTLGLDGFPDARNVLLSAYDGTSLSFHTDSRSRKARELAADPRVALTLVWPDAGRQVVVQGYAVQADAAASEAAFAERSRYLQLLAWANDAPTAALPRQARRERWERFGADHPDGALSAPPTWVGYRVTPIRVTFWRGDTDGPSNRIEYRRRGDGWTVSHLPG
ncbi:pyridoxine/pyridoxamine 5'-phosphate oxidase [Leifsonia sp. AG29]|uniref:pyridoxine/pyridoxamine 5'-phosphate oxidase n=1 Tax=Leifsonia sp. AG29 TaxID=2598860 RepID=UPI00131D10C9|nr:pyridoxamine 5'-phosphate oxidase family protein [Leifsonia sp. AG29]